MGKRQGIEVSLAISEAVKLARAEVIAAYPITPQTHIVEHLSEIVAQGELDAEFVCVESEHSAMSACLGSSAGGARTYTATAGQGLELMHEAVYVASGMRLPIVMSVANRALSSPLSVWGDHSDVMAVRDTGWIQIFAESGQDAFDLTIMAFKIAEDKRVLFPIMVHLDGFHLTHVVEPIEIADQDEVDKFLPPLDYKYGLNPTKPVNHGAFAPPLIYTEAKRKQVEDFSKVRPVIDEVLNDWGKQFGRTYKGIETYKAEDAETLLVMIGSYAQTAEIAVDELRKKGEKVGIIKVRLWRPFPENDFINAIKNSKGLIVLDRALAPGSKLGPLATEIRGLGKIPSLTNIVAGVGGRDILPEQFVEIINHGKERLVKGEDAYEMMGVRE